MHVGEKAKQFSFSTRRLVERSLSQVRLHVDVCVCVDVSSAYW